MENEFEIQELDPDRLQETLELVWRVFLAFEAPDYSDEGVREFKQFIEVASIRQKLLDSRFRMWTCAANGKIVGVLAVRPVCHISLLFVDGAYHKRGIARALLDSVIDYYQAHGAHTEITVNSSPYAVEAYHRLGFADTGGEQTINGIRFVPMKRRI